MITKIVIMKVMETNSKDLIFYFKDHSISMTMTIILEGEDGKKSVSSKIESVKFLKRISSSILIVVFLIILWIWISIIDRSIITVSEKMISFQIGQNDLEYYQTVQISIVSALPKQQTYEKYRYLQKWRSTIPKTDAHKKNEIKEVFKKKKSDSIDHCHSIKKI